MKADRNFSGIAYPFITRVGRELRNMGLIVRDNDGNNGVSILEKDLGLEVDVFLLDVNFEFPGKPQPVCVNAYRVDENGRALERIYPADDEPEGMEHSKEFINPVKAAKFAKEIRDEVVLKAASDLSALGDEIASVN